MASTVRQILRSHDREVLKNYSNKKSNLTPASLAKHYNKRFEIIERNSEFFFGNKRLDESNSVQSPSQKLPKVRKHNQRYASLDSKAALMSIFDEPSQATLNQNLNQASFVLQKGQNPQRKSQIKVDFKQISPQSQTLQVQGDEFSAMALQKVLKMVQKPIKGVPQNGRISISSRNSQPKHQTITNWHESATKGLPVISELNKGSQEDQEFEKLNQTQRFFANSQPPRFTRSILRNLHETAASQRGPQLAKITKSKAKKEQDQEKQMINLMIEENQKNLNKGYINQISHDFDEFLGRKSPERIRIPKVDAFKDLSPESRSESCGVGKDSNKVSQNYLDSAFLNSLLEQMTPQKSDEFTNIGTQNISENSVKLDTDSQKYRKSKVKQKNACNIIRLQFDQRTVSNEKDVPKISTEAHSTQQTHSPLKRINLDIKLSSEKKKQNKDQPKKRDVQWQPVCQKTLQITQELSRETLDQNSSSDALGNKSSKRIEISSPKTLLSRKLASTERRHLETGEKSTEQIGANSQAKQGVIFGQNYNKKQINNSLELQRQQTQDQISQAPKMVQEDGIINNKSSLIMQVGESQRSNPELVSGQSKSPKVALKAIQVKQFPNQTQNMAMISSVDIARVPNSNAKNQTIYNKIPSVQHNSTNYTRTSYHNLNKDKFTIDTADIHQRNNQTIQGFARQFPIQKVQERFRNSNQKSFSPGDETMLSYVKEVLRQTNQQSFRVTQSPKVSMKENSHIFNKTMITPTNNNMSQTNQGGPFRQKQASQKDRSSFEINPGTLESDKQPLTLANKQLLMYKTLSPSKTSKNDTRWISKLVQADQQNSFFETNLNQFKRGNTNSIMKSFDQTLNQANSRAFNLSKVDQFDPLRQTSQTFISNLRNSPTAQDITVQAMIQNQERDLDHSVLLRFPQNGSTEKYAQKKRQKETFGQRNARLGYLATQTSLGKTYQDLQMLKSGKQLVVPEEIHSSKRVSEIQTTQLSPFQSKQNSQIIQQTSRNQFSSDPSTQLQNIDNSKISIVLEDQILENIESPSRRGTQLLVKNLLQSESESMKSQEIQCEFNSERANSPNKLNRSVAVGPMQPPIQMDFAIFETIQQLMQLQTQAITHQIDTSQFSMPIKTSYSEQKQDCLGNPAPLLQDQSSKSSNDFQNPNFQTSSRDTKQLHDDKLNVSELYQGGFSPVNSQSNLLDLSIKNFFSSIQTSSNVSKNQISQRLINLEKQDLESKLEIKIRIPSRLLVNNFVPHIDNKLTFNISLIHFDSKTNLKDIKLRKIPIKTYTNARINSQGFFYVLNEKGRPKNQFNLYRDIFMGQIKLEDLNFTQRRFVIEVEMIDPISKKLFLLRYLTFAHTTQNLYPKIFISIMQNLHAKNRPIQMFDSPEDQVLDFANGKPKLAQIGNQAHIDILYDRLITRDMNYPIVMKTRPRLECPILSLEGIILECPKRKVQIKSLSEFIRLVEPEKVNLKTPHVSFNVQQASNNGSRQGDVQKKGLAVEAPGTILTNMMQMNFENLPNMMSSNSSAENLLSNLQRPYHKNSPPKLYAPLAVKTHEMVEMEVNSQLGSQKSSIQNSALRTMSQMQAIHAHQQHQMPLNHAQISVDSNQKMHNFQATQGIIREKQGMRGVKVRQPRESVKDSKRSKSFRISSKFEEKSQNMNDNSNKKDKNKRYADLKIFRMEFENGQEQKEFLKKHKKSRKGYEAANSSFKKDHMDNESPNKQSRTVQQFFVNPTRNHSRLKENSFEILGSSRGRHSPTENSEVDEMQNARKNLNLGSSANYQRRTLADIGGENKRSTVSLLEQNSGVESQADQDVDGGEEDSDYSNQSDENEEEESLADSENFGLQNPPLNMPLNAAFDHNELSVPAKAPRIISKQIGIGKTQYPSETRVAGNGTESPLLRFKEHPNQTQQPFMMKQSSNAVNNNNFSSSKHQQHHTIISPINNANNHTSPNELNNQLRKKRGINLQVVTSGGGVITRSRDSLQPKRSARGESSNNYDQQVYDRKMMVNRSSFDEEIVNIGVEQQVTYGTMNNNNQQIKFEDRQSATLPPEPTIIIRSEVGTSTFNITDKVGSHFKMAGEKQSNFRKDTLEKKIVNLGVDKLILDQSPEKKKKSQRRANVFKAAASMTNSAIFRRSNLKQALAEQRNQKKQNVLAELRKSILQKNFKVMKKELSSPHMDMSYSPAENKQTSPEQIYEMQKEPQFSHGMEEVQTKRLPQIAKRVPYRHSTLLMVGTHSPKK